MPRGPRITPGGMVFHALNRGNGGATIFEHDGDYNALIQVIHESLVIVPIRILTYCLMPNHWHFVLWPERDDEMSEFFHHATTTHVRRWHGARGTDGKGHLYQGPFKSFPVDSDDHCRIACRYVERNACRANLVEKAEDWTWCSAWARLHPTDPRALPLSKWPIPFPHDWSTFVNTPLTEAELNAVRTSVRRGRPFGTKDWQRATARSLGLEYTLRRRGRPRVHG